MKTIFDTKGWKREEHYRLFSQMDNPYVGVVAEVNCKDLYTVAKKYKISFFALYVFASMRAENQIEEFKFRIENDDIVTYNQISCGTTIGRKDGTFGFAFVPYTDNFDEFNQLLQDQIKSVEESVGLHIKNEDITEGLVRHSTFPWSRFTALVQPSNYNRKVSIPRIIFGKAYSQNEQMLMPVSVEANHAFVDGLHLAQFLDEFEKQMSFLSNNLEEKFNLDN